MTPGKNQRGLTLVLVLWLVAALSLLAAAAVATSRTGIRAAHGAVEMAGAEALGDGAINLALIDVLRHTLSRNRLEAARYTVAGRPVVVTVAPLNGFIDLNGADEVLLRNLFEVAGDLGSDAAQRLARRILDWRDADDAPREGGAEDPDYQAAGVPFRTRNARFSTIDDLMQVLGVDFGLFGRIRSLVVVGGGSGRVNPLAASPDVLAVLAGGRADVVERILARRDVDGVRTDLTGLDRGHVEIAPSHSFRIEARIARPDGGTVVRARLVRLKAAAADGGLPWSTLLIEPARFEPGS